MVWIVRFLSRLIGLSGTTFLYKFDLGNAYARIRVRRQTDQFIRFKDHGTDYIILKTVPPRIDKRGNRHHFMYETDMHTFNPETGKVLDEALEQEFKKRLLQNELDQFKDLLKEAQAEALKKRAQEVFSAVELIANESSELEHAVSNSDELEVVAKGATEIEINLPAIKIGKTRQVEITDLTPHDTISEVLSMILDGTILQSLIKPRKLDKWLVVGTLIVGICLGWMLVILYAVGFPDAWRKLNGIPDLILRRLFHV